MSTNTILNGNGAPSIGVGNVGDYYIDNVEHSIYGPKEISGWPTTGIAFVGPVIRSGAGQPSGSLGNIGDFYINYLNYDLYGPKTISSSWGGFFNLKGEAGQNGEDGEQGPDGEQGIPGPQGPPGSYIPNVSGLGINTATILAGTTLPTSTDGHIGDLYICTVNRTWYGPKSITGWPILGRFVDDSSNLSLIPNSFFGMDTNLLMLMILIIVLVLVIWKFVK